MMYYQPLAQLGGPRPAGAYALAGGWCWFAQVAILSRDAPPQIVPAADIPAAALARLTAPRADIAGMVMDAPRMMGILNVTPDSFSDGGRFNAPYLARQHGLQMIADGADILDIGGESTRPGAAEVEIADEVDRTAPVITALRACSDVPMSIDTRKAPVAEAAIAAGASLINDVAAFTFDPALAAVTTRAGLPVCLMHAQGDPETMQDAPHYDDVLLDVYDFLEERIVVAEAAGLTRAQIIVDPGIGFGKTLAHNVALLQGLSLLHGLGCPVLVGASRKRFIGTIAGVETAQSRLGGSIAVALQAARQGVQIIRVHDTYDTKQALRLMMAISGAESL